MKARIDAAPAAGAAPSARRTQFTFRKLGRQYVVETRRRGLNVYREPLLNKGSAFTLEERRALALEGILPGSPKTMDEQAARIYEILRSRPEPIDKYLELSALQDRNEHLFYRVLTDHLAELMPIVYTPTVGEATQRFSALFRRGRGLWITPDHRGRIREVLDAAVRHEVRLIVATDNESILGIGDQGAGGIAIAVGKLSLYCAGAGLHPALTLPISLDFGTDNPRLLAAPDYLGWRGARLRGEEYFALMDEFVAAVKSVMPRALLQWEDLRNDTALKVLDRFHDALPSFNDDIEGTGAVAVAGVLGAARVSGAPLREQRFAIFGAGCAGLGIARQLRALLVEEGVAPAIARARIVALDSRGLIVEGGASDAGYKSELALSRADARALGLEAGMGLADVLARFAPHGLIGTSGVPGAFTEPMVAGLARTHSRPLVLPLSNPTALCEAVPADLLRWSGGRAIVATGSPFPAVQFEGGERAIGQGNNVFIFPGLGFGAIAVEAAGVTTSMLRAAARAVAQSVTAQEIAEGLIYPRIERLPQVARAVALAVARAAARPGGADPEAALAALEWTPEYPRIIPVE